MSVKIILHDSFVGFHGIVKEININEKGYIEKIKVEYLKSLNDGKNICPLIMTYSTDENSSSKNRFEYLFLSIKKDK